MVWIIFYFSIYWLSYFSEGLKPPTRWVVTCLIFVWNSQGCEYLRSGDTGEMESNNAVWHAKTRQSEQLKWLSYPRALGQRLTLYVENGRTWHIYEWITCVFVAIFHIELLVCRRVTIIKSTPETMVDVGHETVINRWDRWDNRMRGQRSQRPQIS